MQNNVAGFDDFENNDFKNKGNVQVNAILSSEFSPSV